MERYIGLDAHVRSCTFAVMSTTGQRLREQVIETSPGPLIEFLKSVSGARKLCMEEGSLSEWLHELLEPHVDELVVVQPTAHQGNKSDSIDAWMLADRFRRGTIDGSVFKAASSFAGLREAMRAHRAISRDLQRAKLRLNAVFRSRGMTDMSSQIYKSKTRAPWLQKLPPHQRQLATMLGEELDSLTKHQQQSEKWLLDEASQASAIVRRIQTAPGIGPIRAAQIVAIVVTPHRFRSKRQFWSYCGLAVVTRSSADWNRNGARWVRAQVQRTRGLNRNRHPMLKSIFTGAAMTVTQTKSHPLRDDYERLIAAGTKPNLARLTLARRIAATVLALWRKKEDYDPARRRIDKPA